MTMNNPLVSVIMPVYNVEKHVGRSINSVLQQSYTNFELLVVDDGTKDKSIDVVNSFDDPRITLLRKENGGLSDARNFGLDRAVGDLVYFIDSDDWIENDLLEKTVDVMTSTKSQVVLFGYFVDRIGKPIGSNAESVVPNKGQLVKGQSAFPIDDRFLGLLGYAWNKLYDRSILEAKQLRFEKGISLVEDMLFNAEVLNSVDRIALVDIPLYHYAVHGGETLMTKFYPDAFDLKIKRHNATKTVLKSWEVSPDDYAKIYDQSILNAARFSIINLFGSNNELTYGEKVNAVRNLMQRPELKLALRSANLKGIKGWVLSQLVRCRAARLLSFLSSVSR